MNSKTKALTGKGNKKVGQEIYKREVKPRVGNDMRNK